MKICLLTMLTAVVLLTSACSNAQTGDTKLDANIFADKIKQTPASIVIDVRTPEEFAKGHLLNAKNFNWNGNDFQKQVAQVDKAAPVFVYCLSGGRSAAAATKMREEGFTNVYELKGGIMKWRAANLPETTGDTPALPGMSRQDFDKLLATDKLVLIDFYADWCAPCKLIKPYLEEISAEMKDKVQVIRINADDNQPLLRELKIDELPVLQVYKNKAISWTNTGFVDKAEVVKHLK